MASWGNADLSGLDLADVLYSKESVFFQSVSLSAGQKGPILKVEIFHEKQANRVPVTVLICDGGSGTPTTIRWKGILSQGVAAAQWYEVTPSVGSGYDMQLSNVYMGVYLPAGAESFGNFWGKTSGAAIGAENGYDRTNADVHNVSEPDDPIQAGGNANNNQVAIRVNFGVAGGGGGGGLTLGYGLSVDDYDLS